VSLSVFNESAKSVNNSALSAIAVIVAGRRVADAIEKAARKVKINNSRAQALEAGLDIFCKAADRISESIRQNPGRDIAGSLKEVLAHLDSRIDGLVQAIDDTSTSGEILKQHIDNVGAALQEFAITADWIEHRFPVTDSTNDNSDISGTTKDNQMAVPCWGSHVTDVGFGSVFNSFQALYGASQE